MSQAGNRQKERRLTVTVETDQSDLFTRADDQIQVMDYPHRAVSRGQAIYLQHRELVSHTLGKIVSMNIFKVSSTNPWIFKDHGQITLRDLLSSVHDHNSVSDGV